MISIKFETVSSMHQEASMNVPKDSLYTLIRLYSIYGRWMQNEKAALVENADKE